MKKQRPRFSLSSERAKKGRLNLKIDARLPIFIPQVTNSTGTPLLSKRFVNFGTTFGETRTLSLDSRDSWYSRWRKVMYSDREVDDCNMKQNKKPKKDRRLSVESQVYTQTRDMMM